jgi:hypothetical protein
MAILQFDPHGYVFVTFGTFRLFLLFRLMEMQHLAVAVPA